MRTDKQSAACGRQSANQVVDALVRQDAADEQRAAVAEHRRVRRELLDIDATADHARSGQLLVTVDAAAVVAQVQMAVEPASVET